jgi:hypothetical protein
MGTRAWLPMERDLSPNLMYQLQPWSGTLLPHVAKHAPLFRAQPFVFPHGNSIFHNFATWGQFNRLGRSMSRPE